MVSTISTKLTNIFCINGYKFPSILYSLKPLKKYFEFYKKNVPTFLII
jgi:hypothetical protein